MACRTAAKPHHGIMGESEIILPAYAPIMVLPNALLFPNSLLPLHIFEERYRLMLAQALGSDRMFCLALMKPGISEAARTEDFYHTVGLGLIRACVAREDGTSDLVLQGLARVRLVEFIQDEPFRVARLKEIPSEMPNVVEAEALGVKVLELCRQLKERGMEMPATLEKSLFYLTNPEVLSDVVSHTFIRDPFQRQGILEQPMVSDRLRLLIQYLLAEAGPEV